VNVVWRTWAPDLTGHAIKAGHHMAEEAPQELIRALIDFFSRPRTRIARE